MKRYIFLLLLMLVGVASQADNAHLIARLDSLLEQRETMSNAKQAHIDMLKRNALKLSDPKARLSTFSDIYNEYYVFKFDSAMLYVNKGLQLAEQLNDAYYRDLFLLYKSQLLSVGGLYSEAISNLHTIHEDTLDDRLRLAYYMTFFYVHLYWSDYCNESTYSPRYRTIAVDYLRKARPLMKPSDPNYEFYMGEYYIYAHRDDRKALDYYFKAQKRLPEDSRYYAMASFAIANNYSANGNMGKYEEYIIKACISDLLSCTKENMALQDLAMYLFKQKDENMEQAERYINIAMEDAKTYNNRLRILEVSQKLPVIVSTYQHTVTCHNKYLRLALWSISLLVVAMLVLLYFVVRQNKLLTSRRHELSHSNQQLHSLNGQLHALNGRLLDTNTKRESLAKLYIDLCAKYIDKLAKFELFVRRKIKANQINELLSVASSSRLSEDDAATFLRRFDHAFLELYPSFITEFNTLLKPGEQVIPPKADQLTTELRIFALIRLGVNESSEIAALLFYTPRTIYNYRSAFKNKALNRETFEAEVVNLCTVIG